MDHLPRITENLACKQLSILQFWRKKVDQMEVDHMQAKNQHIFGAKLWRNILFQTWQSGLFWRRATIKVIYSKSHASNVSNCTLQWNSEKLRRNANHATLLVFVCSLYAQPNCICVFISSKSHFLNYPLSESKIVWCLNTFIDCIMLKLWSEC